MGVRPLPRLAIRWSWATTSSNPSCRTSRSRFNTGERAGGEPVPLLGALVASSPFDLALHDAFGVLHGVPSFETLERPIHEP